MHLRPEPQNQQCRASVPQNFQLNLLEQRAVIERSLFEPAEHRQARRETDLESSRRLLELEFQAGQLGSPVAMTQRRVGWRNCLEGLELSCVADLPLVKSPAHQPERQFALAFGCPEPTCRLSTGKPQAQLPPPATQGRQPLPRFAPGFSVALLSAVERL